MQLQEVIANAEKVRQEANRERNPCKKNILLEIEGLFRRLAEVEKLEHRRGLDHERTAAE